MLVDRLREWAGERPDRPAYSFVVDGTQETDRLTYAELDRRARGIAVALADAGAGSGRVMLLYPPGVDFLAAFLGCLYAGAIAVPVYPPGPGRPTRARSRLLSIALDAEPAAVLTTAALAEATEPLRAAPELGGPRWITTDRADGAAAVDPDAWRRPAVGPDHLAFLQYTSGSTGTPKGVMVSHRALDANIESIHRTLRTGPDTVLMSWLPLYHDMGLIGCALHAVHTGFHGVLMSPLSFIRDPLSWLRAISAFRATLSGGPNFAYDLCSARVDPATLAGLDLSSWRIAFNGSEPVRPDTLRRFAATFAPAGLTGAALYPCYGLAEATLMVTGADLDAEPVTRSFDPTALSTGVADPVEAGGRELVSCGRPITGQDLLVVDPDTRVPCPPGRVGELWVRGSGVTEGYWGKPVETAETFRAELADGAGGYLRTGDLGFVDRDELYVVARSKDLLIVRGRNYYPPDLERAAEDAHPLLRPGCGAAFGLDDDDRVVLVQEVDRRAEPAELDAAARAIVAAVADACELRISDVVLAERGQVPKTSSGKIARAECRRLYEAGSLKVVATHSLGTAVPDADAGPDPAEVLAAAGERRRDVARSYLRHAVATVLGTDPGAPPGDQRLTALGVDSLGSVELANAIAADLGVRVPIGEILGGLTLDELTDRIAATATATATDPVRPAARDVPGPDTGLAPLSPGQRALWFLYRLAPDSSQYNQVFAARVTSPLDVEALRNAVDQVVARHGVLRTTYVERDGEPYQVIHEHLSAGFEVRDCSTWDPERIDAALTDAAHEPFDLGDGPILRVLVLTRSERDSYILFGAHHIVMDYWSIGLVVDELAACYAAYRAGREPAPPEPRATYRDHVDAHADRLAGPDGDRLWRYWRDALGGELTVLDLPISRPRPLEQTFDGSTHGFDVPDELAERVRRFAQANGTTLYTVLLAAFQTLLHRYSGQDEIVVGSPAAGRSEARFERTVGYFVNMVPLRGDLSGHPDFQTVLARVRDTVLGALDHQAYPFADLVDRLRVRRDPGRSPVFQVAFLLQQPYRGADPAIARFVLGESGARMSLAGLDLESIGLEQRLARFDLELWMVEADGALFGSLRYNTRLFDRASVAALMRHYLVLLDGLTAHPEAPVRALPLIADTEADQLANGWNDTAGPYPSDVMLHEPFEARAAERPDAVAVRFGQTRLTYREVNEAANQIAHHLVATGTRPGDRVAVILDRSERMVPALLGVLKAGAAYVPLEPSFPDARIAWILTELDIGRVLTQSHLAGRFADTDRFGPVRHVLVVDRNEPARPDGGARVWSAADMAGAPTSNPPRLATPDDVAYIIFTSGSTGTPKGVVLRHRPVLNLIDWVNTTFDVGPDDTVLFMTSLTFDLSVYDVFGILAAGGAIRVASAAEVRDPKRLLETLCSGEITYWDSAPAALRQLVPFLDDPGPDYARSRLRLVFLSGDWIPVSLPDQIRSRFTGARIVALGGATEAAIWSNYHVIDRVDPDWTSIPYGRPIRNARYYVLDPEGRPCPVGVPGELHIGGPCLAHGYTDPVLSAQRFVPDPYSPVPGAVMYRTGDRARFWADGTIEFLGRVDQMVKVRGYRVEPGEIETLLNHHPDVTDSVVVARADGTGESRLIAYARPRSIEPDTDAGDDHAAAWERVFDTVYGTTPAADPTFNTAGWNDSYTGRPFTPAQMREWVDTTADRILALPHRRVLEIGCGTGLLVAAIGPSTERYVGVDVSRRALDHVRDRLLAADPDLADRVELRRARADEVDQIGDRFDLVVLNSVAQYFDSAHQLVDVVRRVIPLLAPGGAVFLGDLRNLRLLPELHASTLLAGADGSATADTLRRRLGERLAEERELVVDPALFEPLLAELPGLSGARVLLKRGPSRNELTAFRYDVVLTAAPVDPEPDRVLTWSPEMTPDRLAELAGTGGLVVRDVPNARVTGALAIRAALESAPDETTAAELRATRLTPTATPEPTAATEPRAVRPDPDGVDPYDVWSLSDRLPGGHRVEARWPASADPGRFDVVIAPDRPAPVPGRPRVPAEHPPVWSDYANHPRQGLFLRDLVPRLRAHLRERLPEYMIPAAFVLMDALPVTANGKVDISALPDPGPGRAGSGTEFVPPASPVEEVLAEVWATVLGVERVGVHDRFFDLGGDSILSIQVVARAAEAGVHLRLRDLFSFQTIAELATVARAAATLAGPEPAGTEVPLVPAQRWMFDLGLGEPDHFNQAVLVEVGRRMDPDALDRAVRAVFDNHDAARLRFEPDGRGGWRQYYAAEAGVIVEHVDPEDATRPADDPGGPPAGRLAEVAAELNATLDIRTGPLVRVLRLSGGPVDRLLVVAHHLVVDGVSWGILLGDLDAAYQALAAGREPSLAPPATSFGQAARALRARADTGEVLERAARWTRLLDVPTVTLSDGAAASGEPVDVGADSAVGEPAVTDDPTRTARPAATWAGPVAVVAADLDPAGTEDLLTRAGPAVRAHVDELLLAALTLALGDELPTGRIRVDLESHGRDADPDLDLSRTMGWFTAIAPVVLDLAATGPAEALRAVKEHLRGRPGTAVDYALLRHVTGTDTPAVAALRALPAAEIGVNYLGRLDRIAGDGFRVDPDAGGPIRAPGDRSPYRLELNCFVLDGRFATRWTHLPDVDGPNRVGRLADRFVTALGDLTRYALSADATRYTPADFPLADLTDNALAKLVGQLDRTVRKGGPGAR